MLNHVQPVRSPVLSGAVELRARKAHGPVSQRAGHGLDFDPADSLASAVALVQVVSWVPFRRPVQDGL